MKRPNKLEYETMGIPNYEQDLEAYVDFLEAKFKQVKYCSDRFSLGANPGLLFCDIALIIRSLTVEDTF